MIARLLVTVFLLLTCPLALLAQPRPGAFTTITASSTSATALDVAGGIQAGSGNVGIVDNTGKIPAISSTYFASLSGANLTGIVETAITDGSILARVASTETISATWTFTSGVTNLSAASPFLNYIATGQASNNQFWRTGISGSTWFLSALDDAGSSGNFAIQVSRSGTTAQLTTISSGLALPAVIAPSALSSGSTNNYTPTGIGGTATIILTADAGGSTLTGLAAQAAGTEITLCEPVTAAGSLTIAHESGSSTAANRFNNGAQANITLNKDTSGGVGGPCVTYWYYATGSRWLLKSTSTSVP